MFFFGVVMSMPQSRAGSIFFDSPDETANYFWAVRIAKGESLWYREPLEVAGNSLLRPRSMNVIGMKVVPGSFLGLPLLYGYMAKWLGVNAIPYFTPLFASLAVIAFGFLMMKLFDPVMGLLSAALLAVLPPWWYYASRGMYHNVLFVSLVMIGICIVVYLSKYAKDDHWQTRRSFGLPDVGTRGTFGLPTEKDAVSSASVGTAAWLSVWLFRHWRKPCPPNLRDTFSCEQSSLNDNSQHILIKGGRGGLLKLLGWGVAGLSIGFSLVVRSSELIWIVFLTVFCFISGWRRVSVLGLLLFISCGIFALVPLFSMNIELYGAPISIGYRGVQGMELGEFVSKLPEAQFRNLFFAPFGVSLVQIHLTVVRFIVNYFWWWFWPVVAGALAIAGKMFMKREKREMKIWGAYFLAAAAVIVLLALYYGSWAFSDRIDKESVSLNTSFFRYWLPIYILGIPSIAAFIAIMARCIKITWLRTAVMCIAVAVFAYLSLMKVLNGTDESLWAVQARVKAAPLELSAVQKVVPKDAVVVTFPQADKVLFPSFTRLITALVTVEDYEALGRLAEKVPVYYYTYAPPEFVEFVVAPLFRAHRLEIIEGQAVYTNRWVWRIMSSAASFAHL